jgi:multimeric flavodoxin WrbA
MKDKLTPVLEKIAGAEALILGSPIYIWTVTGEMRSFMERLLFPNLTYTRPPQSLAPRNLRKEFVYTMNVSEQQMKENYIPHIAVNASVRKMMFGQSESLCCNETLQFENYNKGVFSYFDLEERQKRRSEVFPHDCIRTFELGARLV